MSLDTLISHLAPDRLEEIGRNRKAVLWRCWHESKVTGYAVTDHQQQGAKAFSGVSAYDDAVAEWRGRARGTTK